MHTTVSRFSRCACLGVVWLCAAAGTVPADIVQLKGSPPFKDVRVVGLRDGLLHYQIRGVARTAKLASVAHIEIDRYPEYAQAVEAAAEENAAEAAQLLAAALKRAKENEDRAVMPLLRLKLVKALDSSGQFDEALEQFIQLVRVESSPRALAAVPKQLPKDPAKHQAALKRVTALASSAVDPVQKLLLGRLRDKLAGHEPSGEADADAPDAVAEATGDELIEVTAPAVAPETTDVVAAPAIDKPVARRQTPGLGTDDPLGELLNGGQYAEALAKIQPLLNSPDAPLSKLLYCRGVAQQGLDQRQEAAISYMRVAIHFTKSRWAGYCLLAAGKMYRDMDRPDVARTLLKEALGVAEDEVVKQQAQELLDTQP